MIRSRKTAENWQLLRIYPGPMRVDTPLMACLVSDTETEPRRVGDARGDANHSRSAMERSYNNRS
jgi:hypothetical protein